MQHKAVVVQPGDLVVLCGAVETRGVNAMSLTPLPAVFVARHDDERGTLSLVPISFAALQGLAPEKSALVGDALLEHRHSYSMQQSVARKVEAT